MTAPTPALLAALAKKPAAVPARPVLPRLAVDLEPAEPAKIVRPGTRKQIVEFVSDGVFKTKHLMVGQRVRPYVHGQPRGGERIVAKVERQNNGATYKVTWASGHGVTEHAAAYRWFDASMVGETLQRVVPVAALVAYEEA